MTAAPLILEVLWGPGQGKKASVPPGGALTIGSGPAAAWRLDHDPTLAPLHLELRWDGRAALVRALASAETCLDGQPVREGRSGHGGWIRAGATDLALAIERHTPPDPAPEPETLAAAEPVIAALRGQPGRLYALLDGARDERIRVLLRESPEPYRSLFDGGQGDALAEAAPYLVEVGRRPQPLDDLVVEAWDRPWGLYISAPQDRDLEALRRHLRKFLMVELGRERVYFRFYDPRVFAAFVPTCSAAERRELLADLAWHVVDHHGRRLLTFRT